MQITNEQSSVRALMQASKTPFKVAQNPRGATIFGQGESCDTVMHVESGRIGLTVSASSGREAVCGLVHAGSFLGEEVVAGCEARPYTAIAMMPTEVLVISKAGALQLLATERRFAERFVAHMLSRTSRLNADLTSQLLYSSEERLARVLLSLAESDAPGPVRTTLPDVTQEFLARMVGTTRSRVNMFLGKFKKQGFIAMHGGVLQINPALLQGLSDPDVFAPSPRGVHD